MAFDHDSTIAQFVFDRDPSLNLAVLVKELDAALERSGAGRRSVTWDCEDLAFVDLDGARFTLSYTGDAGPGLPSSLMISVGPGPHSPYDPADRRRYEDLCHLLADRLRARFAPQQTLWHQVAGPVTADLIDDLFDRLPDFSNGKASAPLARRSAPAEAVRAFPETDADLPVSFVEKAMAIKAAKAERARAAMKGFQATRKPAAPVANSQPDLPRRPATETAQIRAALYPEDTQTPQQTVRMRLAASTMDITLMVVFLPAGAAMMTYGLMRGGNVTSSARMLALTGALIGLSQLPFASQLADLI
jgi:hypothetical protein